MIFLNIRKKLDWQYFELIAKNQSYWVETVSAIQDIKIYNYERSRRWKWEEIQAKLYHVNKRVLAVTNLQNLGAQFIENIKNMTITFVCATAVINGDITYGVMISTQFIIGMLKNGKETDMKEAGKMIRNMEKVYIFHLIILTAKII